MKVLRPAGLEQGYHDVSIRFGWICNYMDPAKEDPELGMSFRGFDHARRLLLVQSRVVE